MPQLITRDSYREIKHMVIVIKSINSDELHITFFLKFLGLGMRATRAEGCPSLSWGLLTQASLAAMTGGIC